MTEVLAIEGLHVSFGGDHGERASTAVNGVSLSLERGEIFGLVGESGSGKSTIANSVTGLLPRNVTRRGSILVNGREVIGLEEETMRKIRGLEVSMIFQDASASLDPTWSVGAQIAEALQAHQNLGRRATKRRAIELMQEVGIPDAAARYRDPPHRFSGGQRQRIVIAAALANNPRLLIADEPTTALDVTIQAQVLRLINDLRRNHGTTVLLITHDLGVVSQVCDRVGVMFQGRLLEVAPAKKIFSEPEHPYTRALLAANPAWAKRGSRLPVIPPQWDQDNPPDAAGQVPRSDTGTLREADDD